MPTVNMTAHRQWASRPASERYETIEAIATAAARRSILARDVNRDDISFNPMDGEIIATHGGHEGYRVSRWAFKQLCNITGAPQGYLSTLPSPLVASVLNNHMEDPALRRAHRFLKPMDENELAAVVSPDYGVLQQFRVADLARSITQRHPAFHNPKDLSGKGSGLYLSDRDMFIFLIDGGSLVEAGPRAVLNRGVFLWNSDVGAMSFGVSLFTFNVVCGNHIIHGFENVFDARYYHTSSIETRFNRISSLLRTGMREMNQTTETWKDKMFATTTAAQQRMLPADREDKEKWLVKMGVPAGLTSSVILKAEVEEGRCESVWDAVQGVTAYARDLSHMSQRATIEKISKRMLESVA